MNHLRKFNESLSELYLKIDRFEKDSLKSKVYIPNDHITKNEIELIKSLFRNKPLDIEFTISKSMIKDPKNIKSLSTVSTEIRIYTKRPTTLPYYKSGKRMQLLFSIEKGPDDWWIVNIQDSKYYKCDQLEGLVEFIKSYQLDL